MDSVCQQKNVNEELVPLPDSRPEGHPWDRLKREKANFTAWPYAGPYSFSCLCTHVLQAASPSLRTVAAGFVRGAGCREWRAVGSKRQGSSMTQRQCTESHFYFLFIISVRTLDNRWHHSFSPLTSKQGEGMDDRAGSGNTKVLTTRGKMPVYRITFVSRRSSDIAPAGIAGRCAARTMI